MIIDSNAPPKDIPWTFGDKESPWKVIFQNKLGKVDFDPEKLIFYQTEEQVDLCDFGEDIYEQVKQLPVLNAIFLDFFLENPEQIPDNWKDVRGIVFWGTMYQNSSRYVRVLYYDHEAQTWDSTFISVDYYIWKENYAVALRTKGDSQLKGLVQFSKILKRKNDKRRKHFKKQ